MGTEPLQQQQSEWPALTRNHVASAGRTKSLQILVINGKHDDKNDSLCQAAIAK